MKELSRNNAAGAQLLVASPDGAVVGIFDADGAEIGAVFYSEGVVSMKGLVPMIPADGFIGVDGTHGLFWMPGGRQQPIVHPGVRDTGANPNYVPRNANDVEVRLERAMLNLEKRANALVRREKALMRAIAERAAEKGVVDEAEVEVVEPEIEQGTVEGAAPTGEQTEQA